MRFCTNLAAALRLNLKCQCHTSGDAKAAFEGRCLGRGPAQALVLHLSLVVTSQVKNYEGDVEDLGLTFSVEDDFFGQTTTVGLLLE